MTAPEIQLLRDIREQDFLSDDLRARIDERLLRAAPAAQSAQSALADENIELRRMLCLAHAGATAYLDDGEAQDASAHPAIDFLRDDVATLREKLRQRATSALRVGAPVSAPACASGAGLRTDARQAALDCCAEVERELTEVANRTRKAGNLSLRALIKLIGYVRDAAAEGAPATGAAALSTKPAASATTRTEEDKRAVDAARLTLDANDWTRLAQALQDVLDRANRVDGAHGATNTAAPDGQPSAAGVPEEVHDRLCDSAWIAGAKFGWNCGVAGTIGQLNAAIELRVNERVATCAEGRKKERAKAKQRRGNG